MGKWEMVKISELCSLLTDGTHQTPTYSENGYIFLSSKNVTTGKIDWEKIKYIPQELHDQLYKRLAPQKNDILLAKNGTTGICAKVDRDVIFDIYVSLALLRPKSIIEPNYFVYAINNPYTKRKFDRHLKGIGVPNLHLSSIKVTSIPLPPIDEQKRIARNLDLASEIVKGYKEQLAQLDKLVQSVFYEMFGDPVTNEKGWEINKLGKISNLKAGKNIKANQLFSQSINNKYPCYGGNGIRGYIDKFSHDGVYSLIGRQGALCGNVQLTSGKFYPTEHAVVVSPKISIDPLWLNYTLKFLNLNRFQTGAAQPGLNIDILSDVNIIICDIYLQTRFASIVTKTEVQKAQVQQALTEAKNLFNSLMQEYFE